MSGVAIAGSPPAPPEPVKGHPVQRILLILAWIVAIGAFANLVGWDIRGWLQELWDTITTIAPGYIVAGVVTMTVKTAATGFAWYSILRYAYPGEVRFRYVFASYATCVAMNNILPANLGTIVMFVMLATVIASATFAGMIGGFLVEKIFYTIAAIFVYLYLFFTVPGSFDISFAFIKENPWATAALVVGAAAVLFLVIASIWPKVLKWWEQAKEGGQILTHPRAYFGGVFIPSLLAWIANLVIIAIFMAAYAIPITFHTVMSVVGSNSISNSVSVTPGGVGVTQAFNVAALGDVTDSQTATAYSVAQQLVTTAWSILLAIVLMIWVFGWNGGRALLTESYGEAKQKAAEQKAARDAKQAAEKAAKHGGTPQGAV